MFSLQDVFLMIRRQKMTVFIDAKESTSIQELKRMVQGITKKEVGAKNESRARCPRHSKLFDCVDQNMGCPDRQILQLFQL